LLASATRLSSATTVSCTARTSPPTACRSSPMPCATRSSSVASAAFVTLLGSGAGSRAGSALAMRAISPRSAETSSARVNKASLVAGGAGTCSTDVASVDRSSSEDVWYASNRLSVSASDEAAVSGGLRVLFCLAGGNCEVLQVISDGLVKALRRTTGFSGLSSLSWPTRACTPDRFERAATDGRFWSTLSDCARSRGGMKTRRDGSFLGGVGGREPEA
jgi:hypothetical protein